MGLRCRTGARALPRQGGAQGSPPDAAPRCAGRVRGPAPTWQEMHPARTVSHRRPSLYATIVSVISVSSVLRIPPSTRGRPGRCGARQAHRSAQGMRRRELPMLSQLATSRTEGKLAVTPFVPAGQQAFGLHTRQGRRAPTWSREQSRPESRPGLATGRGSRCPPPRQTKAQPPSQ